jgi:hypothetical protein
MLRMKRKRAGKPFPISNLLFQGGYTHKSDGLYFVGVSCHVNRRSLGREFHGEQKVLHDLIDCNLAS